MGGPSVEDLAIEFSPVMDLTPPLLVEADVTSTAGKLTPVFLLCMFFAD